MFSRNEFWTVSLKVYGSIARASPSLAHLKFAECAYGAASSRAVSTSPIRRRFIAILPLHGKDSGKLNRARLSAPGRRTPRPSSPARRRRRGIAGATRAEQRQARSGPTASRRAAGWTGARQERGRLRARRP